MRIARVMLTRKCNFNCEYCCNQQPELLEKLGISFTPVNYMELLAEVSNCDGINITGGEPLLLMDTLTTLLSDIPNEKSVRIYTNGSLLTGSIALKLFKLGVKKFEIGLHTYDSIHYDVIRMALNTPHLFRFSVNKDEVVKFPFLKELEEVGCEINKWSMDECDNDDDVRLILKEEF